MPCDHSDVESNDQKKKEEVSPIISQSPLGVAQMLEKKLEKLLEEKKRKREETNKKMKKKKKKKKKLLEEKELSDSDSDSESEFDSDSKAITSLRVEIALLRRDVYGPLNYAQPTHRVGALSKNDKRFGTFCLCSKLAIDKYNTNNGTNYVFVHYVKAKYKFVYSGHDYTITFKARQPSDVPSYKLTIFRATAYKRLGRSSDPEIRQCLLVAYD